MQQLEGSRVSDISSMAVTAAAPPVEEAAAAAREGEVIGVDGNSGEEEKGDDRMTMMMSLGGNRWPRQETLALLKIRSDMDSVFRDSTLKAPLWEHVSRKLAELGYQRSAKKCKEKFENVYKYHKRTKESRSGTSSGKNSEGGKTYKFFDQLQALEDKNNHQFTPTPQPTIATTTTATTTNALAFQYASEPHKNFSATLTGTNPPDNNNNNNVTMMNNLFSSSSSPASTSSSTASDDGLEERHRKKRKYWKDYFRRLTRQVLSKQEEMQKKFLEAIDNRERERVAQQDSWRAQEIARINKEHDILIQERSTAAAKDAAVIALLHKLSGQQNPTQPPPPPPPPPQQPQPQPEPMIVTNKNFEIVQRESNGDTSVVTSGTPNPKMRSSFSSSSSSSSRWPKEEIHALIRLRTSLDSKYQENGPKAPLWEDISGGMKRLGYSRSSKRCKEKWENINKYFKKVKESNKKRRLDSKTCPYFNELEALYREKGKRRSMFGTFQNDVMMEPLMVQPEQQWRPPPLPEGNNEAGQQGQEKDAREEVEEEEEEYDDDGGVEDEDGDSVEDEGGGNNPYEIVTNSKLSSLEHTLE